MNSKQTLADTLERQKRERAALDQLGLSGRADELPRDFHRLVALVAEHLREHRAKAK